MDNHTFTPIGIDPDKFSRQLQLEEEMIRRGVEDFERALNKSKEKNQGANTPGAVKLIKAAIEPASEGLRKWMVEVEQGAAKRKAIAYCHLKDIEPEVAVYIALRVLFSSREAYEPYSGVALEIGQAIQTELRFRDFKAQQPKLYKTVLDRMSRLASESHKKTVLTHTANKFGVEWEPWPNTDCIHLGSRLIDLIVTETGLFEIRNIRQGKDHKYHVTPHPETLTWIKGIHEKLAPLRPKFLPMVVPPKPWTGMYSGGYWSQLPRSLPFVKSRNKSYLEAMKTWEMPVVYEAVNHVQSVAWQVNSKVLDILEIIWGYDSTLGSLPERNPLEPPPCPLEPGQKPDELDEEARQAFKTWKFQAKMVYEEEMTRRSKYLLTDKLLRLAQDYKNEPEIYFPYNLDFRGRMYAIPQFLQPQGSDLARGLLQFAHGKPLGNQTAVDWLAIHGANLYGYDKVSFEERIQWVKENEADILACANDPLEYTLWSKADKPWQFLAWCFEWQGYCQYGVTWVSKIPVALDGSCNGLQHFSAMLRDEIGGEAVNLVPSSKPQDIYQRVADVTNRKLMMLAQDGCELSRMWLEMGVDRKMTKRPVMVLPYGGTRRSVSEYVAEALRDKVGKENPFTPYELHTAILHLSELIWDSMGEVVVAARQAMDWLRTLAKELTKAGKPLNWVTPSGFWMHQAYYDVNKKRVKTHVQGSVVQLITHEETQDLDRNRQVNGISPNFVHSLDATALQFYVCAMKDSGVKSLALIHDSYGTLAADTERSAKTLREAFVTLYENYPVLQALLSQVAEVMDTSTLPPVPEEGTLNLSEVLDSQFFFA